MRLEVRVNGTSHLTERRYVCELVLKDFLGLEADLEVNVGDVPGYEIRIAGEGGRVELADVFLAQPEATWLRPESLPREPLAQATVPEAHDQRQGTSTMPVIYGAILPDGRWVSNEGDSSVRIGIDLFGSIFFMLTRYEEAVLDEVDHFGRFPAESSLAYREGFLQYPIVEQYARLLKGALQAAFPRLELPPTSAYSAVLSHDVDHPWSNRPPTLSALGRTVAVDLLARRSASLAVDRANAYFGNRELRRDPYDRFGYLMETSEKLGLRSGFYFIPDLPSDAGGAEYSVTDPRALALMGDIASRGHEIGYHASYDAAYVENLIWREVERLRGAMSSATGQDRVRGGRHHYLRWRPGVSWEQWDEAGLEYDSSLGFASQVGFRAGTTRPYRTFSLEERRPLMLREVPLLVMDGSLFAKQYMNLSDDEALATCERLFRRCREFEVPATLLWHNSYLDRPRLARMHREIVALL